MSVKFFKLQSKNLYRDYKTQFTNGDVYDYRPRFFDVDQIVLDFDIDEEDFCLMKAQHIIAYMVGFKSWGALLKATEAELELAKLLFTHQDKIYFEEWEMYINSAEREDGRVFDPDDRLEIFKHVFLNNGTHVSMFPDYRLPKGTQ